ncbi:MAG TPA: hypothetical protein VJN90_03390 [Candidatus Acidoferrales bacterium]|nr:hypothetical protein [Candidatus Acidoferrales bacterium]
MPSFRTKSISTKVSDEEYAQIEKLAGEQTISEWTRDVLLKATKPNGYEQILLAEVIALRTIVLNAFYKLAQNEPLTADEMQRLIAHADETKLRKAQERLAADANGGAE